MNTVQFVEFRKGSITYPGQPGFTTWSMLFSDYTMRMDAMRLYVATNPKLGENLTLL